MQNQIIELTEQLTKAKVRCYDAECAAQDATEEAQQYNRVLTSIAEQLGIMKEVDGKRAFEVVDIETRINDLLNAEKTLKDSQSLPEAKK